MAFWNTFRDQLLALWGQWSTAQRVGFSGAAFACVAAIAGTMIWAVQPEFVVIASHLTPQKSAELVGVLDTEQIGYQLNFSGSAVSVASSDVAAARLALRDELSPEEESAPDSGSLMPFGSPRDEEDRRRLALEQRVAKAVAQIRGIRTVTVQISRPDATPFEVQQSPVTAALVIDPKPGEPISSATAHSIIAIVSRSVPGLTTDNIVLTDTSGRQFGSNDNIQSELGWQLDFKHRLETSLSTNAETLLASMQGVKAVVRVTADIDFSEQTKTSNTYDPDAKVKGRESIHTTEQDGPARKADGSTGQQPTGNAGVASNLPDAANSGADSSGKFKNEQIETEYDNSVVNEQIRNVPGKILRLTVAAVVDLTPSAATPADSNAPRVPEVPALQQKQVEDMIKQAVGYDISRNDEVQVILAPLQTVTEDSVVPVGGVVWEQWQPMVQSISLGLAALVTFLMALMLIKRMKPIVIRETVGPGIPLTDARRLAAISEQAKAHPAVVASILSAWLNEQEQTADGQEAASAGSGSQLSFNSGSSVPKSAKQSQHSPTQGRKAA